jgi:1,4-alpha-glucan branching enzyme
VVSEHIGGDTEFCFYRRQARNAFLCGDFNDWHPTAIPMTGPHDGWWMCRLRLSPGSYQFRYLVDGEWYLDYAAFGIERGPLGTWNSVVLVRRGPFDATTRRESAADVTTPHPASRAIFGRPAGHRLRGMPNLMDCR